MGGTSPVGRGGEYPRSDGQSYNAPGRRPHCGADLHSARAGGVSELLNFAWYLGEYWSVVEGNLTDIALWVFKVA